MNDPKNTTTIRKSKLVTISSTANESDAFANLFPKFIYKGSSRTQKTEVEVSFPSYFGNQMFYEHYRDFSCDTPYNLSFMYVGRNTTGQISHNFQDYKTVEVVEFHKEFQTVNLIFQVINQLPKCREVRIYLDDENILLSKEEDFASYDRDQVFPCDSSTVKVLKIFRSSSINDPSLNRRTRFTDIMSYALRHLPNLEHLYVEGMDGGGTSYDLVSTFCQAKYMPMPRHNISIQNGRTFCAPHQIHQDQLSNKSRNATTQGDRNVPVNVMQPGSCSTRWSQPDIAPAPMKQETSVQNRAPEADVEEVPVPSKVVPTITLSDDENEGSPPKKLKREGLNKVAEPRRLDAASPASTVSASSMTAGVTSNPLIPEQSSSLTSISSSYNNDWESSSDDEREKLLNPSKPERKSTDPTSVIKNDLGQVSNNVGSNEVINNPNFAALIPPNVDFNELQNILNAVKGGPVPPTPRDVKENVRTNTKPTKKQIFREGIHFDRRPKSSSHKRRTE